MPSRRQPVPSVVAEVSNAASWDDRVALLRTIPEKYGMAAQPGIYAAIAEAVYLPHLTPDFAYVHWRPEYESEAFAAAYEGAHRLTAGFQDVTVDDLERALVASPTSLKVFRTIIGLTVQEFSAATSVLHQREGTVIVGTSKVKGFESGRVPSHDESAACATLIDRVMSGALFPPGSPGLRSKVDKPDTKAGWATVRAFAEEGVPYGVFLHQRHYGGAFRQLLDATSTRRGDILEDAVEELFTSHDISFYRTGPVNQEEIQRRFGLTVHPAPDFVVRDRADVLRAVLECKVANDGGTARDKAARFQALRTEAQRLGGVPVFAVLSGLGWARTGDALGPVIRATDGRTFTLANLAEMMAVQPFAALVPPR